VAGEITLSDGGEIAVKAIPLLTSLLAVITTTFPVVAPLGTGTTICVLFQLAGVAAMPLKLTELVPCVGPKFEPVIITGSPEAPTKGLIDVILGLPTVIAADATQTDDAALLYATT